MADLTATFEAGSNGANITTAGGEASATAWDTVTAGTNTYDNTHSAHGSLSAKQVYSGNPQLIWSTAFGTQTDHYGRAYFYFTAFNTESGNEYYRVVIRNGATIVAIVFLNPTGKLKVENAAGGTSTGTVTASLNQWIRVEWHVVHNASTGSIEAKLFNTPDSTSVDDTVSMSSTNTGAQATNILFGLYGGNCFTGFTAWIDDIVANATAYPGPATTPAQTLLASADSVDGAWTNEAGGTTLTGSIDETTASDTDYIQSELSPSASGCRVKLAAGGDPASSSGHEINWRAGKNATGGQTVNMTVKLYQGGGNSLGGGTLIADFDRNAVDAMTDYTETLSGGEADAITDYTDLYLEFHATV